MNKSKSASYHLDETMNTDNTLLSFYCPKCKNRIETTLAEAEEHDPFVCPTCGTVIEEDFKALAETLDQTKLSSFKVQ